MNADSFLDDFRTRLKATGLKQKELAERAGLTQGAIQKLYSGARMPRITTAIALWPFAYGAEFPSIPTPRKEPCE